MYISELKAKYQVRGPTLIRNFSGGMAKPASRSARSAAPRELWHALATDSESKEFAKIVDYCETISKCLLLMNF